MKLSRQQVEDRLTAAWGREAAVVPYRHGNRRSYAVTYHGSHWMPLESGWVGGRQVFEPVSGDWPEVEQDSWDLAVVRAAELARAYFEGEENRLALRRLPRGMVIAEARNWTRLRNRHWATAQRGLKPAGGRPPLSATPNYDSVPRSLDFLGSRCAPAVRLEDCCEQPPRAEPGGRVPVAGAF